MDIGFKQARKEGHTAPYYSPGVTSREFIGLTHFMS